jgi:uncharacterized membrane protein YkvA (DUF1232 family)
VGGKMNKHSVSFFTDLLQSLRLAWRLLWDRRMPLWTKTVPLGAVLYLLWPADLLLDPILGLGQLDDLALILLATHVFIALAPEPLKVELGAGARQVQVFDATSASVEVEGKTRLLNGDVLKR